MSIGYLEATEIISRTSTFPI